jgi:hypothetical protein
LLSGLGRELVCATSFDALGLTAYLLCLLHDGVAWSLAGASHPRALATRHAASLRWELIRHARARGCDVMDLYGAWDERHPLENTSWRPLSERQRRELGAHPVYYPPTLALFAG